MSEREAALEGSHVGLSGPSSPLRRIRKAAGLKQVALAAAIHRSQSYVSALERGGARSSLPLRTWRFSIACSVRTSRCTTRSQGRPMADAIPPELRDFLEALAELLAAAVITEGCADD